MRVTAVPSGEGSALVNGGEGLKLVEQSGGVDLEWRGLNLARQVFTCCRFDPDGDLDERMAVPIFINEVFRRALADGSEPLGAVGAHPDEIAGGDGVPVVAEAVDAAAFEHEQAVFHDVDFDHG